MRKNSLFLLILFIGLIFSACGVVNSDEKIDGIYLRITNISSVEFNSVYISFPGAEAMFENLSAGKFSEYQKLNKAY